MGKKKKSKTPITGKPSSLIDTRVIYCGDNLDHLKTNTALQMEAAKIEFKVI